ncbi:hypothetical protein [Sphingosinicella rhizophila]|uniref:Uncharacterized protein n=1 Tax=Sphingosinicella rhizophila TaxID=3050082 RepID=A0ABU3QCA1_9SPHN|nr:hypothetical protein [Sphingosinicella sp. GR2756]MDT9601023.1 hypothetical protein [Sphingosinicella sp. GR2756]
MHRSDVDRLDPRRTYWIPGVVSPHRDWAGAPGCRRGARFVVDCETLRPSRSDFETFDSELDCLQWIMRHRSQLNRTLPDARIRPVRLDHWLLGLD